MYLEDIKLIGGDNRLGPIKTFKNKNETKMIKKLYKLPQVAKR